MSLQELIALTDELDAQLTVAVKADKHENPDLTEAWMRIATVGLSLRRAAEREAVPR